MEETGGGERVQKKGIYDQKFFLFPPKKKKKEASEQSVMREERAVQKQLEKVRCLTVCRGNMSILLIQLII